MAYTPFVPTPHNYYTIATQGINLGGKKLVINPVSTDQGFAGLQLVGITVLLLYFCFVPASTQYALLWQAGKPCCCL